MATNKKEKKSDNAEEEKPRVVKCPADLQRLRLEKLMKNPDKPVILPERPKEKAITDAPEFVRNVMGSSAGAGSGEFHVYRHLRRKENARQKYIQIKSEKEKLDEAYHKKLEENRKMAEERTAKKRAKRLKKKEKMKNKPKKPKTTTDSSGKDVSESEEDENSDQDENKCEQDVKTENENEQSDVNNTSA